QRHDRDEHPPAELSEDPGDVHLERQPPRERACARVGRGSFEARHGRSVESAAMSDGTPPSDSTVTSTSIGGSILGNRVTRTEDPGLLTGARRYLADVELDRPLHAVFVRSDIAHGIVRSIDADEARAMPGVVAVWTATELDVAPHHGFAKIGDAFAR